MAFGVRAGPCRRREQPWQQPVNLDRSLAQSAASCAEVGTQQLRDGLPVVCGFAKPGLGVLDLRAQRVKAELLLDMPPADQVDGSRLESLQRPEPVVCGC